MGLEDYFDVTEEQVIASYHHEQKKLTTILGMTEKRAFLWQRKKSYERFISSKLPITTIEYQQKSIPPIIFILIGLFFILGLASFIVST